MNDITQAARLISADVWGKGVIGDRAYDSNAFVSDLGKRGFEVVIPARSNRLAPRKIAPELYRRRNVIERWFGRLKGFRRIATRYDKTRSSYAGFVALGASALAVQGWAG